MRKIVSFLIALTLLVSALPSMAAKTDSPIPAPNTCEKQISLYVNNVLSSFWAKTLCINDTVYIPAVKIASLLKASADNVDFNSDKATVIVKNDNSAYFFENSYCVVVNGTETTLSNPTYTIDGTLYVPGEEFASIFDVNYSACEENGKLTVYLGVKYDYSKASVRAPEEETPSPEPETPSEPQTSEEPTQTSTESQTAKEEKVETPVVLNAYETTINSRNLTSDTNYLIWVSKANYSVRLFTKQGDIWRFEKEFPCAIGKVSTPTCEGTFKYYEKINSWKYQKYYVGPVMRFNRGYALHSTLMKYNNTPYDDRVGVKISAGCVRMHQPDIQYLWDTVPLYSTVYVTAE